MEAKLVVVGGKAQANEYAITLPAIVGRSRSADIPLNHPLVSRQHCELFESGGQLMVRDLGSLNGTFIGDSRVTAESLLSPGGHLTIGSVTFEAVYEAQEAEAGEGLDFVVADETHDVDQTVQDPPPLRQAAATEEASAEHAAGEHAAEGHGGQHAGEEHGGDGHGAGGHEEDGAGFDMSWLNDSEQEAAAPAAASADEQTMQVANKQVAEKPAKPGRGAKTKEEPKKAAKPQPAAAAPKAAPASPPAPTADDVPTEFAPAEEHHEAAADDDMDDFFRSLTAQ